MNLKGKVAIITGSGRGIGKSIAVKLAQKGADIVISDVDENTGNQTVEEIKTFGVDAIMVKADVSKSKESDALIEKTIEKFDHFDILVNNAGITRDNLIMRMSEEEWDSVIAVNLKGAYNCIRSATKSFMKQRSGRIVNIASVVGQMGNAGQSNYAAAKEGVIGFTRAVARDMAKYKVTCNAIRPLALTRHFDEKRKDAWLRQGKTEAVREMERSAPEDVAAFVLYLASEEAASITGKTLFEGDGTISLYSEPERLSTIQKEGTWTIELLQELVPDSLMVP